MGCKNRWLGLAILIVWLLNLPVRAELPVEPSLNKSQETLTKLAAVQNNTFMAIGPIKLIKSEVLFNRLPDDYEERLEILLQEIIRRESGGDPKICNRQYGCIAGAGLTGIIPSTLKDCEKALDRKLDVFDPKDNLDCAKWLLSTRGIWPWEPYSGSYKDLLIELDLYDELW